MAGHQAGCLSLIKRFYNFIAFFALLFIDFGNHTIPYGWFIYKSFAYFLYFLMIRLAIKLSIANPRKMLPEMTATLF